MIKIKMLYRYHGKIGKMEQGLIYEVDADYAKELVKHGLAELMIEPVVEKPIHVTAKEIGRARTGSGRFMPKSKVK